MSQFKKCLIETDHDWAALVLRLGLGLMILPHGMQKALGLFGGFGFSATVGFLTSQGIPYVFAVLVILAEFLGGIGLLLGFFTRLCALGVGCVMLGAVLMVHIHNGWFMNWMGNQKGEGIEFFILALSIAVALIIKGGGALSMDRLFGKR